MLHTLEAEISPGMSTAEAVSLARRVEEVGFDRLGISDVVFWPDCFVLQALIAEATDRVHIGAMVTNPYTRHPAVLAGMLFVRYAIQGGERNRFIQLGFSHRFNRHRRLSLLLRNERFVTQRTLDGV